MYIDAACLPSEDVLLGDDEHLMTYQKNGVRGFAFARASFFDLGFQSTPLHALPTGNTRQSSLIQIWAQWMHTGGGEEENSNFSCHAATTDLASSCKYGHPFLRPPPPRLLGSIQIPLLHLLYGRSNEGLFKALSSTDSVVLHGTPDSFFLLPQTASVMQRRASAQLVYPLFKPDSEDFREAWVAVRLELVNQRKGGVQP
ncbi:unnamed protein product [Dibothriocephalus latus]|uniref:Uncharacterized protein n=1 Tax=Dibothriocephalus latus TaxID=60516 RepID=A0A3P7MG17_DIBLA|nr:unnamed protein product [Dibothriocephalus latus]